MFNKGYEQTGEYIVADATDEQEDVSDTLHSHQQCLEQDTHTHTYTHCTHTHTHVHTHTHTVSACVRVQRHPPTVPFA